MWWLLVRVTFCLIAVLPACSATGSNTLFPPLPGEPTRIIHVVSHDWHAGIVVQQSDIHQADWPKLAEFAHMDYLEIGWGDRAYYRSPEPGLFLGAQALVFPTTSVLHIVGMNRPPEATFPNSEIIRIELSAVGLAQMIRRIAQSFSRDENGSVISLGPGLYGFSRFFASEEKYHLLMTCNSWTAVVLQAAGCPVNPTLTVDGLLSQLRNLGKVQQKKPDRH
ncbi:DUF2459 domain-containing protein [Desulfosediminicola ganghwensis]|uniref:DUF2459 domain-containing protein n=1 Tax=Desulfosediminicola ganghwensis TaxID=2569540 RepID=UPI0010AD37B7|nr:DUF2459 domain-containing protein [Desulfosediminicola ganghwensis]